MLAEALQSSNIYLLGEKLKDYARTDMNLSLVSSDAPLQSSEAH